MRTILYQPVYINPQAYFVFPSLYHIEKGDSYVEPAVYTGQLLIDVVDGSASSVIIKDTNNGTDALKGAGIDSSVLHLGNVRPNDTRYLHGAIYYFALYDKSLTTDEIEQEKIKLNEIWTKRLNG